MTHVARRGVGTADGTLNVYVGSRVVVTLIVEGEDGERARVVVTLIVLILTAPLCGESTGAPDCATPP